LKFLDLLLKLISLIGKLLNLIITLVKFTLEVLFMLSQLKVKRLFVLKILG